jgi:integrase
MPTFQKDRKRNPWRGKVKRTGYGEEVAYFPTKDEAIEWEDTRRSVLRRKAKGLKADIADLAKITVGQMVETYLKEETRFKASSRTETYRLNSFIAYKDFKTRPLIAFTRPDAVEYRNYLEREYEFEQQPFMRNGKLITPNRKPMKIKPGTVRRTIATFRDMWNIAANDWRGYESLKEIGNPWSGVSSRLQPKKRTRRLDDLPSRKNELDRLLEACQQCQGINKIYMRLAIILAVQTGMRLQEILLLTWHDVDLHNNRIDIKKSKTDYRSETEGRLIVLPFAAKVDITKASVAFCMQPGYVWKPENRLIQLTTNAFEQAWDKLRERAGINTKDQDAKLGIKESQQGLEFKDLRREAGSRFDEAGLTKAEHDLMLGHESKDIAGIYIAPYLDRIEKKIDAYWDGNLYVGKDNKDLFPKELSATDSIIRYVMGEDLFQKAMKYRDLAEGPKEETKMLEAISNVIPFLQRQGSKQP